MLCLRGELAAEDRQVVHAFASQLGAAIRGRELRREADTAVELSKVNELRSALLVAVSHDLRTPLASIKASVTSLLAADVDWDEAARREFCIAIDEETDRLENLVANLLDMSRIATGALTVHQTKVGVEEIVPAALASLGDRARHGRVAANIPETLPRVDTDPALLERAVANLVDNAIAWSPPEQAVRVEAGAVGSEIHLRVIDHGPGIPMSEREECSSPFNASAMARTGSVSGSGSLSRRGSSAPSAATSTSRTPRGEVPRWSSRCRSSDDERAPGARRRRRATASARAHNEPQGEGIRGRQCCDR